MKTKIIIFLCSFFFLYSCSENEDTGFGPENNNNTKNHYYQIPVVFHILYGDPSDRNQNVTQERINEILEACNQLYNNSNGKSVNMNLKFILATKDPQGRTLAEPGIDRILWESLEMDCEKFMKGEESENTNLIWDATQYINIMLYTFTKDNILGISHLPYTIAPDKYPGLNQLKGIPNPKNLTYPHCVSINNTYINVGPSKEGKVYYTTDVVATLAHELGHYLGLHHAFSQDKDGNTDLCVDTDYCEDTPTYNRKEYTEWLDQYMAGKRLTLADMPQLTKRTDCIHHTTFTPDNVMDYEISYVNRFTADQRSRIRYVLSHSPFVPGPKVSRQSTRAMTLTEEFPIQMLE